MSTGDILKELAAMRAHFELRFDQIKIEMKLEASQLKAEMKTEIGQLKTEMGQMNRRMDVLAERVELGRQRQQNPVDGGGQANQGRVDGAINNAGDEGQDGQEDDDQQDAISVKSEIESGSCQSDCDYGMSGEETAVKEEEMDGDSGTGGQQQQPEEQALFQPVAGPSGISRIAQKRPQSGPPRRSPRLGTSECPLTLSDSSDTSDGEDETKPTPATKKARTNKGSYRQRCPHCSKMVTNLHLHRRTHTGERPYVCQHAHCGKAYTQSNGLNYHLRQYHKENMSHRCEVRMKKKVKKVKAKPRCEQCGKDFVSSAVLARHHLRMHTSERPFRWPRPGCDYASVQKYFIDKHLLTKKHRDE